jgi:hypothetical protein
MSIADPIAIARWPALVARFRVGTAALAGVREREIPIAPNG